MWQTTRPIRFRQPNTSPWGLVLLLATAHPLGAGGQVSFEALHEFRRSSPDGANVCAAVYEGSDGFLYGTTLRGGGPDEGGTVFRMEKSGANYRILHVFGPPGTTNGFSPWGGVIEGKDGRLYGATRHGGAELAGLLYSLSRDGTAFQILHNFRTNGSDGRFPMNDVIQARDGRLYGRTLSGGTGDAATVFGVNPDGSGFQRLHSFEFSDRDYVIAYSGLLEGSDGMLYGTTVGEGPKRAGSVFRLHRDGTGFQTLHFFEGTGKGSAGGIPDAGLAETSEGFLVGATEGGGAEDFGVLYRIERDGSGYRVLHEFTAQRGEGYTPTSPPIEGADGALYGTTYFGGPEDTGAIYRICKDGTGLAFLHTLEGADCPAYPYASLRLCSDGAFYGTTYDGLDGVYGAVFRINPIALVLDKGSIRLHAMAGSTYALETTTGLGHPWSEIQRLPNVTNTIEFAWPPPEAARFFRARLVGSNARGQIARASTVQGGH